MATQSTDSSLRHHTTHTTSTRQFIPIWTCTLFGGSARMTLGIFPVTLAHLTYKHDRTPHCLCPSHRMSPLSRRYPRRAHTRRSHSTLSQKDHHLIFHGNTSLSEYNQSNELDKIIICIFIFFPILQDKRTNKDLPQWRVFFLPQFSNSLSHSIRLTPLSLTLLYYV